MGTDVAGRSSMSLDTSSPQPPRPENLTPATLNVMVVDDDPDATAALEVVVAGLGHTVVRAVDGLDALAKHTASSVDVIVCDWYLPRMTGLELCRRLRAGVDAPYVYFVLITGVGDRAGFLEGMRAGADDYLLKPVRLDDLEGRLVSASRVIALQRSLRARNDALARATDLWHRAAHVDPLTDSANRLQLREDLAALESRASRYGHCYSTAICDVDLFKPYNDLYGHVAGDHALRFVAATIGATLRRGDTLYRYGGEEFLVILPEQRALEARPVMERVRSEVAALGLRHGASPLGVLTISVGIAELEPEQGGAEAWLRRADAALYRAKANGRNRVEVDDDAGQRERSSAHALRRTD